MDVNRFQTKSKRMLSVFLCLILMFCTVAVQASDTAGEYSLTSGDYVRLLGRGIIIGEDSRTFNWPNAGFEFEFSGTNAKVYVDYSFIYGQSSPDGAPNEGCYFNAVVFNADTDEYVRHERMNLVTGWNTIYTAEDTDPENKKIMLVRSSEACRGALRMSKIRCDALPRRSQARAKLIEFIGDSFTAGYANSPELAPDVATYCAKNTDNWNSYTGIVSRYYNADNNVIAHQGKGVYKNQGTTLESFRHTMSDLFGYEEIYVNNAKINMSGEEEHKFYKYQPQLVTIWLGTNDASDYSSYDQALGPVDTATFKTAYEALLNNVREKYPDAVILNMALEGSKYCQTIESVVNEAGGEKNKNYMLVLNQFESKFAGHPDIAEDERIAEQIIAKINSIPNVWSGTLDGKDDTQLLSVRANYNTGEVSAYGITSSNSDFVSAMVTKPGVTIENAEVNKTDIAFLSQVTTNAAGEYNFEFKTDKLEGEYTFYINSTSVNNLQEAGFTFKNLIPKISVTSDGNPVEKMADLSEVRNLQVTLSGFDVEEGFSGMLAVAQYKNGALNDLDIDTHNASNDSREYGTEVTLGVDVADDTDSIKVLYINQVTLAPLIVSYDITQ